VHNTPLFQKVYLKFYFNQGMSSKEWWQILVENVILEDCISKKIKVNKEKTKLIADTLFDEFTKEKYWKKFDNCDSLLNNLRKRGYIIGAISNFDERLFTIVQNLNMKDYFDFILIPSNSNGYYKPQKEIFFQAIIKSKIYTPKNRILHIGDSYNLDYIASKRCEFNSILITHGKKSENLGLMKSEEIATDLYELETKIINKF